MIRRPRAGWYRLNVRRWLAALPLVASCTSSAPLALPESASEEGSLLVVVQEEQGERLDILAVDLASAPPPLSVGDQSLFAILYPVPLATLGLLPGPQEAPGPTDPARPIPAGFEAFLATSARDGWQPVSPADLEKAIGRRVLGPPPQCEPADGCFRRIEGDDGFEYCELPCREPASPTGPAEPELPALPTFGTCPDGWSRSSSTFGAVEYCEPPALQPCGAGSTHLLGDAGCEPIGAVCDGEFAASLPAGRTAWFVRPGATGDGSRAAPFGTLAEAVAAAGDGDVVALSTGVHAGGVSLTDSLDLIGACTETVIEDADAALTVATGATVRIQDLSLTGAGAGAQVEGTASLEGVVVAADGRGLVVHGALEATELLVTGAESGGLIVEGTGTATVTRADLSDNRGYGALVEGENAALILRDVIARGARSAGGNGTRGFGVAARAGARLEVRRILLEDNASNGLAVWSGAELDASDVVERRGDGYSIDLDRASGRIERVVSVDAAYGALWFFRDVAATAKDVYAIGARSQAVTTNLNSDVTFDRVLLEGNEGLGFVVNDGSATVRDLTVIDQAEDPNRDGGFGIHVVDGRLEATRTLVQQSTAFGVVVQGQSTEALLLADDLTVREIAPSDRRASTLICAGIPVGIRVDGKTRFEAHRVLVEGDNQGVAFRTTDDHLLEDVIVRGARNIGFCASDGFYDVDRALIEDTRGRGIDLDGAFLQADDLVVRGTRATEEAVTGIGVRVDGTQSLSGGVRLGQATFDRFRLTDNQSAGLRLDLSAGFDLKNGEISGSEIGIQVEQPAFDPTGLLDEVIYRNNGTNVVF